LSVKPKSRHFGEDRGRDRHPIAAKENQNKKLLKIGVPSNFCILPKINERERGFEMNCPFLLLW